MTAKPRFRVSFSLLETWRRGNIDQAVNLYFRLGGVTTPQMEDGKRIHDEIEAYVTTHKALPSYLPQIPLTDPKPEVKHIVQYSETFDISFKPDLIDGTTLFEYKTGVTDSVDWARSHQVPFYFLGCELAKIPIDRAYLLHYNQYDQSRDWFQIWNSPTQIEKGRNLIDSLAPEILSFFTTQGLFDS